MGQVSDTLAHEVEAQDACAGRRRSDDRRVHRDRALRIDVRGERGAEPVPDDGLPGHVVPVVAERDLRDGDRALRRRLRGPRDRARVRHRNADLIRGTGEEGRQGDLPEGGLVAGDHAHLRRRARGDPSDAFLHEREQEEIGTRIRRRLYGRLHLTLRARGDVGRAERRAHPVPHHGAASGVDPVVAEVDRLRSARRPEIRTDVAERDREHERARRRDGRRRHRRVGRVEHDGRRGERARAGE